MKMLVLTGVMALAGCQTIGEGTTAMPPVGERCDAAAVVGLIGKPAAVVDTEAKRGAGAGSTRTYERGSPVTMDYRADRLNIETDAAGIVVQFSCG